MSHPKSSEQLAVDSLAAVLRHANHQRTRRNLSEESDLSWSGIVVQASQSLVDATKSFPLAAEAAQIDGVKVREITDNLYDIANTAYRRSKTSGGVPVKSTSKTKVLVNK